VCNGKIGTLIANARAKAAKSHGAAGPSDPAFSRRCEYAKDSVPVVSEIFHAMTTIATSISSDPAMV
jgi:hypothetical protein